MLLINRIFSNSPFIWIFVILSSFIYIGMCISYKKCAAGKFLSVKIWRILCFLPLAVCLIHFLLFKVKGNFEFTRYYYGLYYLAALIFALLTLTSLFRRVHKIFLPLITVFCILANIHTLVMPMVWESAMRNHSRESFVDSFISSTKDMEKYYSLKDWKKIDIPALRDEFLPAVQKAQDTNDKGLLCAATIAFCYNFYDGHVAARIYNDDDWFRGITLLAGHDYGLSMLNLEGKVFAVNVEENSEAWKQGIRNKTVITSWNGVQIDKAVAQTEFIQMGTQLPVKATEDMLRSIMLATKGMRTEGPEGIAGDIIENASITEDSQRPHALVGFIDENGNERQIELEAIGSGLNRFEATFCLLFFHRYNAHPELKNFEAKMINDDTAYMVRYGETSNLFFDVLSYFTNHQPRYKKKLVKELNALREEGMKKLIIDVRGNTGGYWALGVETAGLFSNEDYPMAMRGTEVGGKKRMLQTIYVNGEGTFSDIEVLLLVDPYCVSAGDSFVRVLSHCPNVKVMGVAPTNCSCQETGGFSIMSNAICGIVYPVNWLYELNGDRYIDTDETRECTIPLDIQIPLTYDFVQELYASFETGDVILDYAIDYLKQENQ